MAIAYISPLHRHKRVVAFVDLRARVRASALMRHTRNNTSNNGGLAAAAPTSSPSASAAQSASSHLVSVHNQIAYVRNSCGQAAPLGAFPPARGQAAFVRHAAGDVTAAVAGSCCCFEGSGTEGREREARVGGGAREVRQSLTGCQAEEEEEEEEEANGGRWAGAASGSAGASRYHIH